MASLLEPSMANLIKIKSIERVVAPVATHLCQLILICESTGGSERFAELEEVAMDVTKATMNMAAVAVRLSRQSDDDVMRREMEPVVESMLLSGQHVLLAAQKLSIQHQRAEHREELITATQNVLVGVLKVLLVEDDAAVRKIVLVSHLLLDCLSKMEAALDISSLLEVFQTFAEALLLLNQLTEKRIEDLRDVGQKERLIKSTETLKKCVSMLLTATCTTIKQPYSKEAQAAKRFVLDQVGSSVMDLVSTLKRNCSENVSGTKISYIDKLQCLLRLFESGCTLPWDGSCDSLLRDLLIHCMVVANTSRKKLQWMVVDNCQRVLHYWLEISQQAKLPGSSSECKQKLRGDMEDNHRSLAKQLQSVHRTMVTAILYQALDVFVTATVPFEELVNTAGQTSSDQSNGNLDSHQPLLTAFLSHTDRMIEVAAFVSALSTDGKSVENVENSVACLMSLRASVPPLLLELGAQRSDTLEKLKDLSQRWAEQISQLMDAINDIADVTEFTGLTIQEVTIKHGVCERAFEAQDYNFFCQQARVLVGCMNLVMQSVRRGLDRSDNPIFRNGLLVLTKQVAETVAEVKASLRNICADHRLDGKLSSIFSEKVLLAVKQLHLLRDGLNGLQHPHLLSPLREDARQSPVLPSTPHGQGHELSCTDFEKTNKITHCSLKFLGKDVEAPGQVVCVNNNNHSRPAVILNMRHVQTLRDIDLLPPLHRVLNAKKEKDPTALNMSCTEVLQLSNCYVRAAEVAEMTVICAAETQKLVDLRSEILTLTLVLVQATQETDMTTAESIYKQATLFSDRISDMRQILLPVAGAWYHSVHTMLLNKAGKPVVNGTQELSRVMGACTDFVHTVTFSDVAVKGEPKENVTLLRMALEKAQANAKQLTELVFSFPVCPVKLEGQCILWALSIQVLLNSVDKILGVVICNGGSHSRRHHLTLQKRLGLISENSLRIQEATRLSRSNCKNGNTVKKMSDLQQEVKDLTEAYLQASDDFGRTPLSDIHQLARTELLQRQLQLKMTTLARLIGKVNKEYATGVQSVIHRAVSVTADCSNEDETEEARVNFESVAESLLGNVKATNQIVQDCLHYIRDPRVRTSVRSINEHLIFQTSEIVRKARQIVETRDPYDTQSLDIQTQCWSAKAHFLVAEIDKVEGIQQGIKEQLKLSLQDAHPSTAKTPLAQREATCLSGSTVVGWPGNCAESRKTPEQNTGLVVPEKNVQNPLMDKQQPKTSLSWRAINSAAPSLTDFLKRPTDRWDGQNNHIVQVTRDMAEKIYHMTQYLRRKGPIQTKEAFVSTAKDLISKCQSIVPFIKVIGNHCLDRLCREDLHSAVERILTVTNQLTIISSVNAVAPRGRSSDEPLVKNAQDLLHAVLRGIRAAETACVTGLKQPDPDSDGAKAAALCFRWKQNLLIHRAEQNIGTETDDLGLRRTLRYRAAPTLGPPIQHVQEAFK